VSAVTSLVAAAPAAGAVVVPVDSAVAVAVDVAGESGAGGEMTGG
jgi:hypothetical protein